MPFCLASPPFCQSTQTHAAQAAARGSPKRHTGHRLRRISSREPRLHFPTRRCRSRLYRQLDFSRLPAIPSRAHRELVRGARKQARGAEPNRRWCDADPICLERCLAQALWSTLRQVGKQNRSGAQR
ncbi:hypothetical protein IE81DRAFT_41792 [Ceraceosorus guamensis]|uniref:Uncharacterized protein n=1 Tax=Ceraceosorus guamensis TaxID=1522189 RepID=A0A316VUM7_9BASI|nr:hypothetical protein IE81DRAFT_41792 [Ceraceosorus guamensis]PWN39215.1 hypothetical protein IE81DRAFT_41792 [Ceraceosorus guamensis]